MSRRGRRAATNTLLQWKAGQALLRVDSRASGKTAQSRDAMGLRDNAVQAAANIALSGARATRDARDASEFGALMPRYEKFESLSLQRSVNKLSVPLAFSTRVTQ